MKHRAVFAVTLDALGTFLHVPISVGHQYRKAYAEFLTAQGIHMDRDLPGATDVLIGTAARRALKRELETDRAAWGALHPGVNPKEMPIGGLQHSTIEAFWSRVLCSALTEEAAMYTGCDAEVYARVRALHNEKEKSDVHSDWNLFIRHVVQDVFGSSKAYQLLPEGRRTLECLREWNSQQLARLRRESNRNEAAASSYSSSLPLSSSGDNSACVLTLAQPPIVVTNVDYRLHRVLEELGVVKNSASNGAPSEEDVALPPLLSSVFTATDVGASKPSARGLQLAACEARLADKMDHLIHVGDGEADLIACQTVGCRYVACDPEVGVVWEDLLREIHALKCAVMSC